jgi:cbb3-type cytochrome oxidase maturation protein
MSIVFLLIPLGLAIVAIAAAALLWAVDSGQYDGDVESRGMIVLDDDAA